MKWQAAAITHVGRRRPANEDAFFNDVERGLFVVADGMGGHAAGEIASTMAVDRVVGHFVDAAASDPESAASVLAEAVRSANLEILARAEREPEKSGMGTTLTALAIIGEKVVIAHVGDSRAYRLRDGVFAQITVDHTWVEEQVSAGLLAREQARFHPFANIITRALGTQPELQVDAAQLDAKPGDLYLLCSDGLTGMLDDAQILELIAENRPLDSRAKRLIQAANRAGGLDNITAILIQAVA
jgi:PPM family protein phosphatase